MLKLRKSVYNATMYVGGLTTDEVIKKYNITDVVKLGSNENNYAPFASVREVMHREIDRTNVYPEKNYEGLRRILGAKYGVSSEWVALGHGAGNVLDTISKTFLDEGDEVIIPNQTYGLYKEICLIMGAKVVSCDIDENYAIDVDKISALITPKTKLIWICNPNNPTSTVVERSKLEKFIESLPEHVYLVMDEAYVEFAKEDSVPNTIDYVKKGHQVMAVRTFSKYYGLAGQRVGYIVAKPELIDYINTVAEPFNANRMGLAAAVELIQNCEAETSHFRSLIWRDREHLVAELRKLGLEVVDSQTNFLFVKLPMLAKEFNEKLLCRGVIARPCVGWGYPNHMRITIGTTEENNKLLIAIKSALESK
ncbi:MAG: histidinol-phosphate transaminase [Bacillota bacterium]